MYVQCGGGGFVCVRERCVRESACGEGVQVCKWVCVEEGEQLMCVCGGEALCVREVCVWEKEGVCVEGEGEREGGREGERCVDVCAGTCMSIER